MSQYIRIKAPSFGLPVNIVLSGKGVARVNESGDLFDRCPIEDYSNQGVQPSSVMPGVQAFAPLLMKANPSNNDTLEFTFPDTTTRTYTFKTSGATGANQLNIGQNAQATLAGLVALINADTGSGGVLNKISAVAQLQNTQMLVTAGSTYAGAAGNGIVISGTNLSTDWTVSPFDYGVNSWGNYVDCWVGFIGVNEIQKVVFSAAPTGSFTLQLFAQNPGGQSAPGVTTPVIPDNANAAQIQAILAQTLNPFTNQPIQAVVTGTLTDTTNGISIQFVGLTGNQPVSVAVTNNNTGATPTVTEVQAGLLPSNESGPDMDLSGVYQLSTTYEYESGNGNEIAMLVPVETVRNQGV